MYALEPSTALRLLVVQTTVLVEPAALTVLMFFSPAYHPRLQLLTAYISLSSSLHETHQCIVVIDPYRIQLPLKHTQWLQVSSAVSLLRITSLSAIWEPVKCYWFLSCSFNPADNSSHIDFISKFCFIPFPPVLLVSNQEPLYIQDRYFIAATRV